MSFPHVLLPYLWIDVDAHTIPWKTALIKAEKRLHGPFKRRGALDTYAGSPKTRVPPNKDYGILGSISGPAMGSCHALGSENSSYCKP